MRTRYIGHRFFFFSILSSSFSVFWAELVQLMTLLKDINLYIQYIDIFTFTKMTIAV